MPKPIYDDEECPLCDGKGTADPNCPSCNGVGRIRIYAGEWGDCPDCLNEPCEMCGGRRQQRRRF